MHLDHLVVAAESLAEGTEWVESVLGTTLDAGGEHDLMGTHNRLISLGDTYLEVIAINPDAPPPGRVRWFGLDTFSGPPRLTNWVLRCDDMEIVKTVAPGGPWQVLNLSRGALSWQMALPRRTDLPFDGLFPALIRWQSAQTPAQILPDRGFRLKSLTLAHPQAASIETALRPLADLAFCTFEMSDRTRMSARISGPNGEVELT